MMPREAIDAARKQGARLELTGQTLHVHGWRALPRDLRLALREHKPAVIALLRDEAAQAKRLAIPEAAYASLGLVRRRGVWTHALGDQYAADILSGKVSRAEATAGEQRADRQLREMVHTVRRPR
jgi:hypothetical protein